MRILLLGVALLLPALLLAQTEGPVTLGGVTYDRVDPGPAFTESVRPVQDWPAPVPTALEQAAGMIPYVAPDPGAYRSYRIPRAAERVSRLSLFLTPGEDEPVTFAVYTVAPVEGLGVQVEAKGAPVQVAVRHMHCWPQRTGWKSRQWYLTPELLLPCGAGKRTVPAQRGVLREEAFDVPAGQTVGFWITLTAAADAKPGRYHTRVLVAGAQRTPLALPLEIQVLPFRLERPADRSWVLYGDVGRWRKFTEEQIRAEMRDYARHGMTGLIEIGLGQPNLSQLKAGKVTYDASTYRRWATLGAQEGLPGPHVIGSPGAMAVRDTVAPGRNLQRGEWPQSVKDGVAAVAQAAVEATRDLPPWYYYGVDEPSGANTYAIQDYQAWHAGGARTYATFYDISFLDRAAQFLTAPCFITGLISHEKTAREAREACARTGAEFWWYGTGSYVNPFPQEGFMWHNRYGAGLLFWKSGARASATWTFCRPHEDVFNDFDGSRANSAEPKEQATAYPHLLQADDWTTYQGAIPTIAWESLREGVDDYRYLYTLQQLTQKAQNDPREAVRRLAEDIDREMRGLVEAVPYANPMGPVGFEATALQRLRRVAADRLMALQAALQGGVVAPGARPTHLLTLQVRTAAGAARLPAPSLALPATDPAPVIDGQLSDAMWSGAAVASPFVDLRDGSPAAVATTVRAMMDDQGLYVAFHCAEPQMAAVEAKEKNHDGQVWMEDSVEVFVAGAARRPYAHVIVTTAGVVLDEVGQDAQRWNPKLPVAVQKGDSGWTAELALPWAALAQVGIERRPVLALNFGRNRYTGGGAQIHTAWSCTYGSFHEPGRFGLGLVQEAPVALRQVTLPARWGAQSLGVELANLTPLARPAKVVVRGAGEWPLQLSPAGREMVQVPVNLRQPGPRNLALSWSSPDVEAQSVDLAVDVPAPFTGQPPAGLLSPGQVVTWPVSLNLSAAETEHLSLALRLSGLGRPLEYRLPARAGETLAVPLRVAGPVRARLALVNEYDRTLWETPEQTFVVLGE